MDFDKTNFYEDGVGRILELMRDTFGDYFKAYFDAELLNIPEESLPCIMVTETTGTIEAGATTQDDIVENITIMVILNKKDDLGATENSDLTGYKVRKLIKGQVASENWAPEYAPKTVMRALRTNMTLNRSSVNTQLITEFGPNLRGENLATEEGHVTIQITRNASVLSRQD